MSRSERVKGNRGRGERVREKYRERNMVRL